MWHHNYSAQWTDHGQQLLSQGLVLEGVSEHDGVTPGPAMRNPALAKDANRGATVQQPVQLLLVKQQWCQAVCPCCLAYQFGEVATDDCQLQQSCQEQASAPGPDHAVHGRWGSDTAAADAAAAVGAAPTLMVAYDAQQDAGELSVLPHWTQACQHVAQQALGCTPLADKQAKLGGAENLCMVGQEDHGPGVELAGAQLSEHVLGAQQLRECVLSAQQLSKCVLPAQELTQDVLSAQQLDMGVLAPQQLSAQQLDKGVPAPQQAPQSFLCLQWHVAVHV